MHNLGPTIIAPLALLLMSGAHAQPPSTLSGTWEGTYKCAQGPTGLSLQVREAPLGTLHALFTFYPVPSGPHAPEGCFTMAGVHDREGGGVSFKASEWIVQPYGYVTVDLSGSIGADGETMAGKVYGPGCTVFSLKRTAPPHAKPNMCSIDDLVAQQGPQSAIDVE